MILQSYFNDAPMNTTEHIQLTTLSPVSGRLQLSGELTVKNAQEIKEHILRAIQSFKQLEILIEQPESLDITLFQLLQATRKSAHKRKKKLMLTYHLSEDMHELWRKAGLTLENQ